MNEDFSFQEGRVIHSSAPDRALPLPKAFGIESRGAEQAFLLSSLLDEQTPVVTCLGPAGAGKTLLTLAAAMEQVEKKRYDEIILMRPTFESGRFKMGFLPGSETEKQMPFFQGYRDNMQQLLSAKVSSKKGKKVEASLEDHLYPTRFLALNYMRGASWIDKFVIIDEAQVLNDQEMLTIGSRVGKGTKIVFIGDLKQRDGYIAEKDSGLKHLIEKTRNHQLVKNITLTKVERSPVCQMFVDIFDG